MADYTHTIDRWDDATGENTRIRRGFIATPELRTSELIRWTCGVGQMAKRKMLFHPDCVREKNPSQSAYHERQRRQVGRVPGRRMPANISA